MPTALLQPGTRAPDFNLPVDPNKKLSLKDFANTSLVLVFYPADFSPVCGDQLALYNEALFEFDELGAQILGVSVDGIWCHQAYADARKLKFPLLSDFEPKGAVSRAYGAYDEQSGTSQRALFVIDNNGVIRWSYLSPIDVNPGAAGIIEALEALKSETPR
jgi:peroxiredoxin